MSIPIGVLTCIYEPMGLRVEMEEPSISVALPVERYKQGVERREQLEVSLLSLATALLVYLLINRRTFGISSAILPLPVPVPSSRSYIATATLHQSRRRETWQLYCNEKMCRIEHDCADLPS